MISKGEREISLITQMDCCSILGIDPKTLRHWCSSAQIQFRPHPMDGRLKCLTQEQVQQLAREHDRPSPLPVTAAQEKRDVPPPASSQERTSVISENEASLVSRDHSFLGAGKPAIFYLEAKYL